MLHTRSQLESLESERLAPYALRSGESRGRLHKEPDDVMRLCFQRDKERVIHSKAFRRLNGKTQVVIAGLGDHYRTRLTHTLEVAQISRDLARRLGANEDLCEVIGLAHDLGHPPFGHAGEGALSVMMQRFGGYFEHNEQSRRVVEYIEQAYPGFRGLNLSLEVIEGMIKHQTAYDQAGRVFEKSAHLEAQLVNRADEIAYTAHDIDDGLRSGILDFEMLLALPLARETARLVEERYGVIDDPHISRYRFVSMLPALCIENMTQETARLLEEHRIESPLQIADFEGVLAQFEPEFHRQFSELRQFLYDHFYTNERILAMNQHGMALIHELFEYYLAHPEAFPHEYDDLDSPPEVYVKDYIAGMTDRFIIQEGERLLGKDFSV